MVGGVINFARRVKASYDRLEQAKNPAPPTPPAPRGYVQDLFETTFNGDKFPGGFGLTKGYYFVDYYTLRLRSYQLFTENLYARGLITRLLTNEINTGLVLEATPNAKLIGLSDEEVNEWTESVETLFTIYGNNKRLVDWRQNQTYGELQREVRKTAILSGDALVLLRQSPITKLPTIEIIDGAKIKTPMGGNDVRAAKARGNTIRYGVEVDKAGRHVAYYVESRNDNMYIESGPDYSIATKITRVLARGPKSKRRIAWMVYGSEKRVDEVRGMPLLACVLQALKELDRYKDSEQRAAVINSMLALFVQKDVDKPGTLPITGGAVRKDTAEVTDGDGSTRNFNVSQWMPGAVIDELQVGEKPVSFDTRRPNVNFAVFEEAIISAIAWANEIPPEILKLSFNNNFSASRAAINEFKIALDASRTKDARSFDKLIYEEWLISMVLTGRIGAPGFLEAWRDPRRFDVFGAWILSEWAGAIKPSVDREKEVKAYERMVNKGWITNDRASKELTGTKFSTNVKRLVKENEQLIEALQPLIAAGIFKQKEADKGGTSTNLLEDLTALVDELREEGVIQ